MANPKSETHLTRAARDAAARGWTLTVRPSSVGGGWVCEIVDARLARVSIALAPTLDAAMFRALAEGFDPDLAEDPQASAESAQAAVECACTSRLAGGDCAHTVCPGCGAGGVYSGLCSDCRTPQFDNACRHCGADISSLRADAKFCGSAHRVAYYRQARLALDADR